MDEDSKNKASELAVTDSQALAKRSASLVKRGLLNLSTGDIARAIEAGKALASSLDFYKVLSTFQEKAGALLPPNRWSLLLMDADKQELHFEIVGGRADAVNKVRIKPGRGITGWVAQSHKSVVVPDVRGDSRFFADADGLETESLVAVPLLVRDECLGVIQLINSVGPEGFSEADLTVLQTLADFTTIALDNARRMQRTHELTIIDERTGLYNARHLNFTLDTEIYRCQRYKYDFSLIAIGLQNLRNLAESMGHNLFEKLIIQVAETLNGPNQTPDIAMEAVFEMGLANRKDFNRGLLRLIDLAFRFGVGGETEFYLLLPQTSKQDACVFAKRLHKFFNETAWLREVGLSVRLPASIAVAAYPVDSDDKYGLLKCLEQTLELAKSSKLNGAVAVKDGIL